jgi:hypothetical protein
MLVFQTPKVRLLNFELLPVDPCLSSRRRRRRGETGCSVLSKHYDFEFYCIIVKRERERERTLWACKAVVKLSN